MARSQHLPLYQAIFTYTREIYKLRTKFPKLIKYDLGQEVSASSIKLLKCVVLANGASNKELFLNRLMLETEVQWALLRLLYELSAISIGQFKLLSERLSQITKQGQAWLKWVQNQNKKSSNTTLSKKTLAENSPSAFKDN